MKIARLSILAYILTASAVVIAAVQGSSYAPIEVSCDSDIQLVRRADGLSQEETKWLSRRESHTREALKSFLERATANFSDTSLISQLLESSNSSVPRIAVACSGGGYRAMLSGAGMLAAMDNRTDGANEHGLGGLLQATTYLAGLSGGSWLVGTLAYNNWTSVQDIIDHSSESNSIWNITASLASPGGTNVTLTNETWGSIIQDVNSKQNAGYAVTITDYWGRALSYGFFPNAEDGGVEFKWSSLRDNDIFMNGEMPFPISVADFRRPNTEITYENSTILEFNPFEMGSWDDSLHAFTDLKYLGTEAFNGVPVNEGQCVTGFDNVGFVVGTSSSLFSPEMSPVVSLLLNNGPIATIFEKAIGNDSNDVANYSPNPFKGINADSDRFEEGFSSEDYLYLADGGEDGETLPLVPLVQKDRSVDVIFALDNSADTARNWPNGTAIASTYERQFSSMGEGMSFPHIPSPEVFVEQHLNERPTFFGCNADSLSDLDHVPPLVIYVPNAYYTYKSNQSTFKLSYNEKERLGLIQNGFEAMTRANLTDDAGFAGCVACAIMRRQQESLDASLPDECSECFASYCWDSKSVNSTMSWSASSSSIATTTTGSTSTLAPSTSMVPSLSSSASSTATAITSTHKNGAWSVKKSPLNHIGYILISCLLPIVNYSM